MATLVDSCQSCYKGLYFNKPSKCLKLCSWTNRPITASLTCAINHGLLTNIGNNSSLVMTVIYIHLQSLQTQKCQKLRQMRTKTYILKQETWRIWEMDRQLESNSSTNELLKHYRHIVFSHLRFHDNKIYQLRIKTIIIIINYNITNARRLIEALSN